MIGENFPYTNFHDMNLDWMIKIAKDFLDQYTQIQDTITQGLNDLQSKYDTLEGLLDAWYNEHSEDIANQLASALEDLNTWYTTHEGYLNQYLTDSIDAFTVAAQNKAEETIASIPDDYTELATNVSAITHRTINIWDEEWTLGIIANDGSLSPATTQFVSENLIPCEPNTTYCCVVPEGKSLRIAQYASDESFINFLGYKQNKVQFTTGATTYYLRFNTAGTNTITYGKDISINIVQSEYDYNVYWPYIDSTDYTARQLANKALEEIDNISDPTGNIWNEDWVYGYIDNSGADANPATPAFRSNDFIPVVASTTYYACVKYGSIRVAQYTSNHTFISFLGYFANNQFTTGATTAYIKFWSGYAASYPGGISIKPVSDPFYNVYTPYIGAVDSIARAEIDAAIEQYVVVGATGDYTTVSDGFAAAISQNKGCIIMPGVYDLVDEGVTTGTGITAPKHVIGYGAKIVVSLPEQDWDYSAINMSKNMDEVIIEGLEIEVTNCRYCVHDEEYNRADYYHHVFRNCKMKHNSFASAELTRPICIGGGFGNACLVEIENCQFSSKDANNNDVNYHANSNGQTGTCVVKCKDSIFETSIGITGNAQTGFVNEMYVCGCLVGVLPADPNIQNSRLIQWNNTVNE